VFFSWVSAARKLWWSESNAEILPENGLILLSGTGDGVGFWQTGKKRLPA
jgi:hypothetical protein